MKIRVFTPIVAAVAMFLAVGVQAAKPGGGGGGGKGGGGGECQNTPLRWEMADSYPGFTSAITSDGSAYVHGSSGVEAVIQVCSGSGDATLRVGGKGKNARKITFDFNNRLASTSATPAWAVGPVTGAAFVNIRSLAFEFNAGDRDTDYSFTTWMGSTPPAPSGSWGLHMLNPVTDANVGGPEDPLFPSANNPYLEAKVIVQHCTAGSSAISGPCVGVTNETWFVSPDPSEINPVPNAVNIAELVDKSSLSNPVNAGQFAFPFFFVISVQ